MCSQDSKMKKNSHTWTIVWRMHGGGSWVDVEKDIRGMNGNEKIR